MSKPVIFTFPVWDEEAKCCGHCDDSPRRPMRLRWILSRRFKMALDLAPEISGSVAGRILSNWRLERQPVRLRAPHSTDRWRILMSAGWSSCVKAKAARIFRP